MKRMWSKIKDYNYSISNDGLVRNDKSGKIKRDRVDKDGYKKVDLYKNGERKTYRVHRLIANAYINNCGDKPMINHKDGNKTNNRISNLEWVTNKENMIHAFKTGLAKPSYAMLGKKNPNAGRRTKVRVVETGKVYDTIKECSEDIGGRAKAISKVLSKEQHTHRNLHFEYV